jgi:dihydrolipoamide dehydrogenase
MTMNFDIAIIGGGPAGYNAAEKAASLGLKTVLFEKNLIGGVCLNEGCIPTKTLLYSAKILDNIKASSKYGVLNNGNPSFDLEKMIIRKDKTVRKLTAGVKMKLTSNGVTIIQGAAKLTREEEGSIYINCDENEYSVTYILLCSGSETVIPPIKGLSDVDYWTSKEALETKVLPANLTIIGGGVIGMEFASFFNSLGVKVTVIEMMPEILGNMDKETSRMLRAEYAKKGIEFHLDTKVIEVNEHQVTVVKNDNTTTVETDKILVSVGRKAKTDQLGLENFNIELLRNGVKVNEYMQTSHPRIYACGDITGYSMLAHTAIREGEVAINHILGKDDRMSYKAIPAVVYTNPELAGVGKTEEDLSGKEVTYHVVKLPMAYAGRWVAENEQGNGLCKLITDEDEHVIGCHIMGNPASELIVIAGIAIEKNFTLDEFRKFVFPHPTVGEIIHESLYL